MFADLPAALEQLADPSVDGLIVGRQVADASRYGSITVAADGHILRFEEKRAGAGAINAGIYLFRHRLLAAFPTKVPLSLEREVFCALTQRDFILKLLLTDAPFLDMGTPESLSLAEGFVRENMHEFLSP